MDYSNVRGQPEIRTKLRALRPFLWSFLFILGLYGIRVHQRLVAETTISFKVTLDGSHAWGYGAVRDGIPVTSGNLLPLGNHTFEIRHPKGRTFRTNFFQLYGARDFGTINLTRGAGSLEISIASASEFLTVHGDEFQTNVTSASMFNCSLPTGEYSVIARFPYHTENRRVTVEDRVVSRLRIDPPFGALEISANQPDATFAIVGQNGVELASGPTPKTRDQLLAGSYQISVQHHGHTWKGNGVVEAGKTNRVTAQFVYGAALIDSTPPGAEIIADDGRSWGKTPRLISELEPGAKQFAFRMAGYESHPFTITIEGDKTNATNVKLTRTSYVSAMKSGQMALVRLAFDEAVNDLESALREEPGDVEATRLLNEAQTLRGFARTEEFGRKLDVTAGVRELELILKREPQNEKANRLLAEFKKHALAKAEEDRVVRLNRGKTLFAALVKNTPDAREFESHEMTAKKALRGVQAGIVRALQSDPAFKITKELSPHPDAVEIVAEFELMTALRTSAGKRKCIIVCAQTTDDETQIHFKVLEYRVEAVNKFSIGAALGTPVAVNYFPIRPSKTAEEDDKQQIRIREGIADVKGRISRGIEK